MSSTISAMVKNNRKATKDKRYADLTQVWDLQTEPKRRIRRRKQELKIVQYEYKHSRSLIPKDSKDENEDKLDSSPLKGLHFEKPKNLYQYPEVNFNNSNSQVFNTSSENTLPPPLKILKSHVMPFLLSTSSPMDEVNLDWVFTNDTSISHNSSSLTVYHSTTLQELNIPFSNESTLKEAFHAFFANEDSLTIVKQDFDVTRSPFLLASIWMTGLYSVNLDTQIFNGLCQILSDKLLGYILSYSQHPSLDNLQAYRLCYLLGKKYKCNLTDFTEICKTTFTCMLEHINIEDSLSLTLYNISQRLELELLRLYHSFSIYTEPDYSSTGLFNNDYFNNNNYMIISKLYSQINYYTSNLADSFLDKAIIIKSTFISHILSIFRFHLEKYTKLASNFDKSICIPELKSIYDLYFSRLNEIKDKILNSILTSNGDTFNPDLINFYFAKQSSYMSNILQHFISCRY